MTKKSAGKDKKLPLKKKTVKKVSDEDLKKVGGGMRRAEMCTATCTGHWDSFSPNCGGSCNGTK
ncbi:MAG TPA: hypothetical protein VIF62_17605 [Labilithrix sp.]|jgi:hypothetical protein